MIIFILIALVSAAIHNLVSIANLKKQIEATGKIFSIKEYFQRNSIAIAANLLCIIFLALISPHLILIYPNVESLLFIFYALAGYGGSDIFESLLGGSQKRVIQVVSETTK